MRLVTSREMQELDRRATEEFGIPSLTLMENAGRGVAEIASEIMGGSKELILILAGKGNNGGDGVVAARHLWERKIPVHVVLFTVPSQLKDDPAVNFQKMLQLKIPFTIVHEKPRTLTLADLLDRAELVIDALFGIGLKRELGEPYSSVIQAVNHSGKKVLAVDIPSGLNADNGEVLGAAVKATLTATLGLPKKGLYEKKGPEYSGEVRVVEIGIPKEILES